MNDVGTTPSQARMNVFADVSPQFRNRYTEMQRTCCTPLCVLKVDTGDWLAAVERCRKRVFHVRVEDHRAGVSDWKIGSPLREVLGSERIALLRDSYVQLANVRSIILASGRNRKIRSDADKYRGTVHNTMQSDLLVISNLT
jgi:hypothetical protein